MKIYARQEPTTDDIINKYHPKNNKKDTVFYHDKDCKQKYCRIPWHHSNRPVSRKTVTLNCFNYQIEWV